MIRKDSYRTPSIDSEAPLPDIGDTRFSGDRFYSREFMRQEWSHR